MCHDKVDSFCSRENREDTRENVGLAPNNVHVPLATRVIDVLKFRNAARLRVISGRVITATVSGRWDCSPSSIR
jgi:hypothetical protein